MEALKNKFLGSEEVFSRRIHWCSKSIFHVPPISNSIISNRQPHTIFISPLCSCFRYPINLYQSIIPFIRLLSLRCSPSTILHRVAFIVVDSIKPVFSRRFFAHIIKKVRKVFPLFRVRDATTTIMFIGSIFFIITSLAHSSPRVVFASIYSVATMLIIAFITHPIIILCLFKKGIKNGNTT